MFVFSSENQGSVQRIRNLFHFRWGKFFTMYGRLKVSVSLSVYYRKSLSGRIDLFYSFVFLPRWFFTFYHFIVTYFLFSVASGMIRDNIQRSLLMGCWTGTSIESPAIFQHVLLSALLHNVCKKFFSLAGIAVLGSGNKILIQRKLMS